MVALNLAAEMERLPPEAREILRMVGSLVEESRLPSGRLFLVGGVVRDLLLGCPCLDIDIVGEGDALSLAEAVARRTHGRLVVHKRFGTATVRLGEFRFDFAAARSETYSHPGALPEVRSDTLKADLFRRDFTINAMAVDLTVSRWGTLIDYYGGLEDVRKRCIRVLHPGSFVDDATRILRAIRYEQRLGFRMETGTARLLRRDLKMLDTISGDRLRHEIELVLGEERPERILRRGAELGVLQQLHPSLKGNGWLALKFPLVRELAGSAKDMPALYLSLLVYHLTPEEGGQLLDRLKVPGAIRKVVRDALEIKSEVSRMSSSALAPGALYRWLHLRHPLAIRVNALAGAPMVRWYLELFLRQLSLVKPLLSGEDLMALGVPAGSEMGRLQEHLREERLEGRLKTRGDEEALVKKWIERKSGGC
ncbi:MAG: hypothetical protein HW414_234 [Dehalococcoidia bacterium]|nr:hypothetical protein [Dehalococcoidia bacterium]